MELLYRLLGFFSAVNDTTRRFRINFIPFNLIVMTVLALLFCAQLSNSLMTQAEGRTSITLTLPDLFAGRNHGKCYVTVEGVLHPDAAFTFNREGEIQKDAPTLFVPFTEEGDQHALLARMSAKRVRGMGEEATPITLTGTLNPININTQQALLKNQGWVGDYRIHGLYQLNAWQKPGDPLQAFLLVVLTILLGLMLTNLCMRYLVFRPMPELYSGTEAPGAAATPIVTRATGDFQLGNVTKRFQNMPAILAAMENGDPVVFANIDASSSLYGITINKLSGFWLIAMRQHGIHRIESGRYYYGIHACPALRVIFINTNTGGNSSAVLAFPNEEERMRATHFLSNPAPLPPVPTPVPDQPVIENKGKAW